MIWCRYVLLTLTHIHIILFTFMHLADAFIQSDLKLHSGYTFLISTCVPWESNPQPFALLTQCSTTEPHRNTILNIHLDSHDKKYLLIIISLNDVIIIFFLQINYISRLQVNRGENDHETTEVVCFSDICCIKLYLCIPRRK